MPEPHNDIRPQADANSGSLPSREHSTARPLNHEVTFQELEKRVRSGERLMVQCVADWNRRLDNCLTATLLEIPQHELDRCKLVIMQLNCDDESAFATLRTWKVSNLPALVVIADGSPLATLIGIHRTANELSAMLREWFKDEPQV